jgi:hypothetical protein
VTEGPHSSRGGESEGRRLQALLAEHEVLRREIEQRSAAQRSFFVLSVPAIGAVASVSIQQGKPMILLAVPFVLPFCLAVWQEHNVSIACIGYYVGTHLTARIGEVTGDAKHWDGRTSSVRR